ncbi:hypothetical protein QOT17_010732 [Balamuthia mandrillaris]
MEKGENRPPNPTPTTTTKQTARREARMATRGALHRIRWRPLVVGAVLVAAALAVALWGKEEGSNVNKGLLQLPATATDNDLAGAVVATTSSASTSGGTGSPRGGESEMTVIKESVLAMVEPTTTKLQWKLTLKREVREEEQQEAVKDMSEDKRELQQVISHLLAGVLSEPSPQPPRQEGGRSGTFVHVMDQPTRRKVTSRFPSRDSRSGSSTGSSTTSKEPILRDWFVYEVKVETSTETFLHFYRLLLEGMLRGLSLPGPDHTQWYVLSAHLLEAEDKPPGQLDSLLFILGATLLLALFVFGLSFLCGSLSGRRQQHQPPKQD